MKAVKNRFLFKNFIFFITCLLVSNAYCVTYITNLADLQQITSDPSGEYVLTADIDASSVQNFTPLCSPSSPFTGKFDGNNHTIKNLTINLPNEDYVSLFGWVGYIPPSSSNSDIEIKNIKLENVNIIGRNRVGALVGEVYGAQISNCTVTGTVQGLQWVGGLIGINNSDGNITQCSFIGSVNGESYIAGLISTNSGSVTKCFSAGIVSAIYECAGLIGTNTFDGISYGSVSDCFSACKVTGSSPTGVIAGGLIAWNEGTASVTRCYAVGELYGYWDQPNNISGTYGLFYHHNPINPTGIDSYWDIQTTGTTNSDGGLGKTTDEMKQQSTYTNWDFNNVWEIQPGCYPTLRGLDNPYLVEIPNVTGMSQSSAESEINLAKLTVGNITQECNNTVPAGQVISQTPAPGTQTCSGNPIDLVVSTGNCPVSNAVISGNPSQLQFTTGDTLVFKVEYEGGVGEVNFQWYFSPQTPTKDAVPIPGATSDTLVITNLQVSNSGWYWCEVSDEQNVIQTPPVHVQVEPGVSVTSIWLVLISIIIFVLIGIPFLPKRAKNNL